MTTGETQDQIRDTLVVLIARNAGVPAESIERNTSIWTQFPASGTVEHPSVTSFVEEVHSEFDVYLTEEEWDDPTLERLAQIICAKRANPAESTADWQRERSETQKGARITFVLVNLVIGPIALIAAAGSWSRRVLFTLGLLLFMNTMLLLSYRKSTRRFRSKPSAKVSSSRT